MNTKKVILLIFLLICMNFLFTEVVNSSEKKLPTWIAETPKGSKFFYYSGIGSSKKSLEEAKQIAISDAVSEIVKEGSITINGSISTKTSEIETTNDNNSFSEIVKEINISGESQKIKGLRTEDIYWQEEKKEEEIFYRYWVLMRLPKNIKDIDYQINQNYGFAPVWRSALVPGWGQFYKKQSKMGYIFLGSEAFLIGSALFANHLSVHYNDKAAGESNITTRKEYMDWSDTAEAVAITTGIAAGVLYIYNIFDSITSKGAKRYAISERDLEIYASVSKNNVLICFQKYW